MEDRFVARPAPFRILLLLLGSLCFVALGIWFAGLLGAAPKPGREWVGWLSILFFGFCFILGISRLFDRSDAIVVDQDGLFWRERSDATIPWSEIQAIESRAIRRQRFICVYLKDARLYPPTTFLGRLGNASRNMGFGDIALSTTGTNRSLRELRDALQRFAPAQIVDV
jgi:hypothetical protein